MARKEFNRNGNKKSQLARAAKQYVKPTAIKAGRNFEYKMPKILYNSLLEEARKGRSGKDGQEYLCDYVNEQFGLMGSCVRVLPM